MMPEEPRTVKENVTPGKSASLDALLEDISKQTMIQPRHSAEMIVCKEHIRTAEYRVSNGNRMPRVKKTIKNTSEVSFRNTDNNVVHPSASIRRQRMRSQDRHERRITFEPSLSIGDDIFQERLNPPPSFEDKPPGDGPTSRRESEEELTPRRRTPTRRKHSHPLVMESSVDYPVGYPHTPLPLLHSLHQQTKHESSKQSSLRHRKSTHRKEEQSTPEEYDDPLRAPPPMFAPARGSVGDQSGSGEEWHNPLCSHAGQTPRRYYQRDRAMYQPPRPLSEASKHKRMAFKHGNPRYTGGGGGGGGGGGRRSQERNRSGSSSGSYHRYQGARKRTSYGHSSSSEENINTS